jgi:hypothetical protein
MKKAYKNILSLISLGAILTTTNSAKAFVFGENQENEVQASFGYYTEKDRINVLKGVIDYKRLLDTNKNISARFSIDSLTGASPNGAIASKNPQTFSSPSGKSADYIDSNEIPTAKFEDTRFAFSTNYEHQYTSNFRYNVGGALSTETDYLSLSLNSGLTLDFNNKNTSISFLNSFSHDTITAEGDIPIPYEYMNNPTCKNKQSNNPINSKDHDDEDCTFISPPSIPYTDTKTTQAKHKNTNDLVLGATQIINKWSLMQLNYFTSISNGYHNDPYKVVSVVDSSGNPLVRDPNTNLSTVIYENRPNHRIKQGIYTEYKATIFTDNIPSISYRYAFDDWGIKSNTVELKYYKPISKKYFIQPYLRYYNQTSASFYTPYLTEDQATDAIKNHQYISSDYRLSQMQSYSVAFEFGIMEKITPWSIMIEYYHQTYKEPYKFGDMQNITINPNLNAFMVLFNVKL